MHICPILTRSNYDDGLPVVAECAREDCMLYDKAKKDCRLNDFVPQLIKARIRLQRLENEKRQGQTGKE